MQAKPMQASTPEHASKHMHAARRDSGCLASVAELLLLAGKEQDLSSLTRGRLLPALAAACVVVAVAAQVGARAMQGCFWLKIHALPCC